MVFRHAAGGRLRVEELVAEVALVKDLCSGTISRVGEVVRRILRLWFVEAEGGLA